MTLDTRSDISGAPLVELVHCGHQYGAGASAVVALEPLNLSIPEFQKVTVVGPSGCGKTTLLNIVAGLLHPSTGEAKIGGKRITAPGADRAVVFQGDAVFPWMTVADNLAYGPRAQRLPKAEIAERVSTYLDVVGLSARAGAFPKTLSGGMRKRVDLARAYANHPRVLLMDEPFGALDTITKERMQSDLLRLGALRPTTIVFITHDLEEALFLGDRVLVMSTGPARVVADIPTPFDDERPPELRMTPEFQRLRHELRDIFVDAQRGRSPEDVA